MSYPFVLVKNLPYSTSTEALYELFTTFGKIHQIRIGDGSENAPKGTCIVVYSTMDSAKKAALAANGVNFQGRYLVTQIYSPDTSKLDRHQQPTRVQNLHNLKLQNGIQ